MKRIILLLAVIGWYPGFNAGVFGEEASCEKQWCNK